MVKIGSTEPSGFDHEQILDRHFNIIADQIKTDATIDAPTVQAETGDIGTVRDSSGREEERWVVLDSHADEDRDTTLDFSFTNITDMEQYRIRGTFLAREPVSMDIDGFGGVSGADFRYNVIEEGTLRYEGGMTKFELLPSPSARTVGVDVHLNSPKPSWSGDRITVSPQIGDRNRLLDGTIYEPSTNSRGFDRIDIWAEPDADGNTCGGFVGDLLGYGPL